MNKKINKHTNRSVILAFLLIILCGPAEVVKAIAIDPSANDVLFYSNVCNTSSGSAASGENRDYQGRPVFSDEELSKIKEYQPLYEKAVSESGYPWQLLAVIHLRESGLSKINPSNGQGLFQDYHKSKSSLYTAGMNVSDEVFVEQALVAVNALEGKINLGNNKLGLSKTTNDLKNKDTDTIKMILMGYNGFAKDYLEQAKKLGYEVNKGFEGSPYVMNKADEKRDPEKNPSGWGQIKLDNGGIQYPANGDYGAFVMFSALSGTLSSNSEGCGDNTKQFNGDIVFYEQTDKLWGDVKFGTTGNIAYNGCGATASAIIASTLLRKEITPKEIAQYDEEYKLTIGNAGYHPSFEKLLIDKYKLKNNHIPLTNDKDLLKNNIEKALDEGKLILTSGRGTVPYTAYGHFVVIYGKNDKGNWLVANPYPITNKPNPQEVHPNAILFHAHNQMTAWHVD